LDLKSPTNPILLKQINDWETSSDIAMIYKAITKNKKIIREKVKNMLIIEKTRHMIQADNLIGVLKEILGNFRMNNTQWKIIVAIGDKDRSSMIDFDLFMNIVEASAKKASGHPKFN
jgi:hypothetical protein